MSASAGGEMNTAKNGLQWIDELEGTGPSPVKARMLDLPICREALVAK
jgi:hypothetical protein